VALRWEPTHVTKHCPRVVPLQLLKKLQLSFLRIEYIMHWIIEMWYYRQEEDNLNRLARTVLYMLFSIMSCYFQRGTMGSIQEFQSVKEAGLLAVLLFSFCFIEFPSYSLGSGEYKFLQ